MKRILIYTTIVLIISTGNSLAKSFKSKNGYQFELPKKYEVIERKYMNSYMSIVYNSKDSDDGKNIMFIMTVNDLQALDFLQTYTQVNIGDEFCNAMHQTYKDQSPRKDLKLYQCTKQTKLNYNNVLKTIYDAEHNNYFQYQYTFKLNNKLMMVTGTCKKNKCGDRDRKLIAISNSLRW